MKYIFDPPTWTEDLKVLTADQLIVPGLEMFGYNRSTKNLHILEPHMHQTTEFLCIANGSQKYYIEDQEYVVHGNQVLIVDADVPHSSGTNPYGRYEHLWFRMDVELFASVVGASDAVQTLICQRLTHPANPVISLQDTMYSDLLNSFFQLASPDPAAQLRGYAGFLTFISSLIQNTEPVCTYSPAIQKALTYINDNICSHIPLTQLADLCSLSLSGFKQKFRRETGITPREYINLLKIDKAKELLAAGNSVTETAFALDFTSSSYFSVLFRQVTDQSPSEYIQSCAPKEEAASSAE